MEVYIDDMITNWLQAADHVEHLWENFELLLKLKMWLNLKKYEVEVTLGKFLGFMVEMKYLN